MCHSRLVWRWASTFNTIASILLGGILAGLFYVKVMMKNFKEILPTLDDASHVQRIELFSGDGRAAGVIENKPGSHGSIRVYHHLHNKWGSLCVAAAHEGLAIYAEHTADAKLNPGKHPNIDRLIGIMARKDEFRVEIVS